MEIAIVDCIILCIFIISSFLILCNRYNLLSFNIKQIENMQSQVIKYIERFDDLSDKSDKSYKSDENKLDTMCNASIAERFSYGVNKIPENRIHGCDRQFKPQNYYKHYSGQKS